MPTYEYRCANGHLFELFQRMSEDPVDTCPECSAPAERQLSAGAGLLFKGSGFYITDYRSDSYKKAAEKDSAPAPAKEGGDASKKSGDAPKKSEPARHKRDPTGTSDQGGSRAPKSD